MDALRRELAQANRVIQSLEAQLNAPSAQSNAVSSNVPLQNYVAPSLQSRASVSSTAVPTRPAPYYTGPGNASQYQQYNTRMPPPAPPLQPQRMPYYDEAHERSSDAYETGPDTYTNSNMNAGGGGLSGSFSNPGSRASSRGRVGPSRGHNSEVSSSVSKSLAMMALEAANGGDGVTSSGSVRSSSHQPLSLADMMNVKGSSTNSGSDRINGLPAVSNDVGLEYSSITGTGRRAPVIGAKGSFNSGSGLIASSPFATADTSAELRGFDELDRSLTALMTEKMSLDDELERLQQRGGKTLKEKTRAKVVEARLGDLGKEIAVLRRNLALKPS